MKSNANLPKDEGISHSKLCYSKAHLAVLVFRTKSAKYGFAYGLQLFGQICTSQIVTEIGRPAYALYIADYLK